MNNYRSTVWDRIRCRLPGPLRRWFFQMEGRIDRWRYPMTDADLNALRAQDDETLADWWNTLNRWGWPDGLPDPEPSDPRRACGRRTQIAEWIERRIGYRFILEHMNVFKERRMTAAEFNEWWRDITRPSLVLVAALAMLTACTSTVPVSGCGPIGKREGRSACVQVLGFTVKDAGDVRSAARAGGIDTVRTVDISTTDLLGIYRKSVTIVTGN